MKPICAILIVIAAITVALLATPFVANAMTDYFPKGKHNAGPEDVAYLKVDLAFLKLKKLREAFAHGDKKDPYRNFNTSSCVKIDHRVMKQHCPELLKAFFTPEFAQRCARAARVPNLYLNDPDVDVNACFLRQYIKGDFLAPHYDNNFSVGTRYTAVIPLHVNSTNSAEFLMYDKTGAMHVVPIPPGHAVVYDGWRVRHAITAQRGTGERIVFVLHLYTDPAMNWWGRWRKWARDVTYSTLTL